MALIADVGLRSHHPASYTTGGSAQLISAARQGNALLVQATSGTVYLGGPGVTQATGTPLVAPALFADASGSAWYAFVPAASSLFADEIY